MKIFNFLHRRKNEDEELDWRDLNSLPKEAVSKKELDSLQKEVVEELRQLQEDAIRDAGETSTAKPQTLYYYHKYIDAKFSKEDFDIDTYFTKKQNIIDQKYAEGLGDIKSEFTGYKELLTEIREVDQRLRRKINKLDPSSNIDLEAIGTYDDSEMLLVQINELSAGINWKELGKEEK
ncbi:MAG: hypothetical protein Q4A25_00885 [Candidatus Saccharibacteria bacterium]|nr:hypothetical protein [Candidatus Saccharibacteria bacterium]